MTLRIGMVARTLNAPHLRGTGRYIQEVLRNSKAADGVHWTVFANNPALPLRVPADLAGETDVFGFRGDRFELWEQIGLPLHARRAGVQLLHCGENTVPLWQPMPTVVTIHDTVLWEEPRPTRLDYHYLHHVQGLAYRRCSAVITISESSRRDIARRWPFLADRLVVIPHGIADEFFQPATAPLPPALRAVLEDGQGRKPYLLYVGGPQPRKRFGWALDLLASADDSALHLVACGFGAAAAQAAVVPSSLVGRVHFAPFVSDAELVALYQGARVALYPTLYEGFGFPAVEAQAAGTPVLFSPVSSLADLVGPLTWAVPAQDPAAWQVALRDALSLQPTARAERVSAAQRWARSFAWRKTAQMHLDLYRRVLAGDRLN
ncbi:glycosyltransferase family 4 protein [Rubrivivax rivuli]|uniref:Glycosyltransferase family 1 protein n=1 Tax=Rubrivivax rivuli TaxID=1862385 RepID=A0A437RSV7_9BURK|nr:glycosyltransferase family 1 protein [Rubrivivax rivuli]RVU49830.1 glycosyltransferase family 1 protein [Rubrivivax rivuli]